MRKCIKWLLVFFLVAGLSGQLFGFGITKVIEVGPCHESAVGTFKWSPDGSKLAYRYGNSLWIADTLGASREVAALELGVVRSEWLSNKEVVVGGWRPDVAMNIVKVDVISGQVIELARWGEATDTLPPRIEYEGPFMSLEGNVYYRKSAVP